MSLKIAYLGPEGTNSETAALYFLDWQQSQGQSGQLCAYTTIAQTLQAVAEGRADLGVVPVENSIEGSVTMTLDSLWKWQSLQIQRAIVLPIIHALISRASSLATLEVVYSHPQALAQCQGWLEQFLPKAERLASNSTSEALQHVDPGGRVAAIASPRAAKLYGLPHLVEKINDYADNCTRFLLVGRTPHQEGSHTSLAFSLPANVPGALVRPLQIFAARSINMTRIESRPTKRSLGEYIFFIDVAAGLNTIALQSALEELAEHTEALKVFGSYQIISTNGPPS